MERIFKKQPISLLSLTILDDKNKYYIRKEAEWELIKRLKNSEGNINDILHMDEIGIKERGFNGYNYLFSPKVNMQRLMEVYFNYCLPYHDSSKLLFSERHLCNNQNFLAPFFDIICKLEINNITKRIETAQGYEKNIDPQYIETLLLFRDVLIERKEKIEREREGYNKSELFWYNDAFEAFDPCGCIELNNNLTPEQLYKLENNKLYFLKNILLELLNDSYIIDCDPAQTIYSYKKILEDSSKLRKQKLILLKQALNEYQVDYSTKKMQKAANLIKRPVNKR